MAYWRPSGAGFVPGVEMRNYSDAKMRELEAEHPGIREGGAFERVDERMPEEDEPGDPVVSTGDETIPATEAAEAAEGEANNA